jgi:membrane-bound serine protease (ClpP class)
MMYADLFPERGIRPTVRGIGFVLLGIASLLATARGALAQQEGVQAADADAGRAAFLVEVPLPLIGNRDELIERQVSQIISQTRGQPQRPIVVLRFAAASTASGEANPTGTRGTRFERALSLARFLTSPAASRARLIAYVADNVEGHAVLPVLACEEIIATETGELGRAAIDENAVDETVAGAYRDIARRRGALSDAVVQAMLSPNVEVVRVDLASGDSSIVTAAEAKALRDDGQVLREETLWTGGSLAAFTGGRMRQLRWVGRVVNSVDDLPEALGLKGRLQQSRMRPDEWRPALVDVADNLDDSKASQIIRAIRERKQRDDINLVVLRIRETRSTLDAALRLASFLSQLDTEGIATASVIEESLASPALLAAVACETVVALESVDFGPDRSEAAAKRPLSKNEAAQRTLIELEKNSGRPAALMAAAIDESSIPKIYVNQQTGKRAPLVEWQVTELAGDWLPRETLTQDGRIPHEVALRYGLVDEFVSDWGAALRSFGLEEEPPVVEGPWLEGAIRQLLARDWVAKLLVTIGLAALFIELGSPGLGAGGFIAAICFVGFFWIEMLNGNVEWLEILLFICGLIAVAIEIFVLPGFGIFGIGGLLMILASIVLASQTFVVPNNSEQLSIVANNLFWVAMSALAILIGAVFMRKQLEASPALRWMTLQPAGIDDIEDLDQREAVVHWEHLLGQDGITTTRLNPAGKAQFGRHIVNVLGTNLIGAGEPVRVVEVRGNSIFVEPHDMS